jgi:hypothetical protein
MVTRDLEAAQDVLVNHPDAVPGQGTIIRSEISESQFQQTPGPVERDYPGFYPYAGLGQWTEIPLRTPEQFEVFNNGIVR